jgi:outer membrane receptor protein involved in Fe transport
VRKNKHSSLAFAKKSSIVATELALVLMGAQLAYAQQPERVERVEVTGTRIRQAELESNSPMVVIPAESLVQNADITLDTMLNTLPQVNPVGTTTSNNPPNNGQSNIDLRGLGPNRNLVLIDGRRPMVSASDQTIDLNTIPSALIESVELITGGVGAVYGADAVAGVVNIKTRRNFQGVEVRAGISDSEKYHDAQERFGTVLLGGNFADRKGNAVIAFDYSDREGMIKSQRPFAKTATATTSFFPEGTYRPSGANLPAQGTVDALYAGYSGVPAGTVPNTSVHGFNTDGTLFYPGIFNSPRDVLNFRYPIDDAVNTNLYPDVYSYNFDAVNILVLPLERRSVMAKLDYRFDNDIEAFGRFMQTNYYSLTALAPTPLRTVSVTNAGGPVVASSPLVEPGLCGTPPNQAPCNIGGQLIVPTTNPFIPADLATLLASRAAAGDDPRIVGSGPTEPFLMRWRITQTGLRQEQYDNNLRQYLAGAKGPLFGNNWKWEGYLSYGYTTINQQQRGNIDTNRLLQALNVSSLAAADAICAGGVNPFGRDQPLSAECRQFLLVTTNQRNDFEQSIGQLFFTGDVFKLPAGPVPVVLGAEYRNFEYDFDPGGSAGPISGFNAQTPSAGTNWFRDFFAEISLPLARNAPLARSLELSFGYRYSQNHARNDLTGAVTPKTNSDSWATALNWQPSNTLRVRASAQQAVRAPNFGELFDGTDSAPQIFDPCSVTSVARSTNPNVNQLCLDTGATPTHVQTPGTQASITLRGNENLKPEKARSYTLGTVWQPAFEGALKGFQAAVDYWTIRIKDAMVLQDSNEFIADCYNYYGNNPTYDPNYVNCLALGRAGDILEIFNPDDPAGEGAYRVENSGKYKTSGLDFLASWGTPIGPARLDLGLNATRLLEFEVQSLGIFPNNDFAGTVPFFGAGGERFGSSLPKWKVNLTGRVKLGAFSVDARMRYIDKMKNMMEKYFPGETEFQGVPAVTYWDFGASWEFWKNSLLRVGVNNAFDKQPPTYRPNVQSGTDPSTYDVIGRRLFAQTILRFQ